MQNMTFCVKFYEMLYWTPLSLYWFLSFSVGWRRSVNDITSILLFFLSDEKLLIQAVRCVAENEQVQLGTIDHICWSVLENWLGCVVWCGVVRRVGAEKRTDRGCLNCMTINDIIINSITVQLYLLDDPEVSKGIEKG